MYSFANKTYRLIPLFITLKIPIFLDFDYNIILLLSFQIHVNILTNSRYSHFLIEGLHTKHLMTLKKQKMEVTR